MIFIIFNLINRLKIGYFTLLKTVKFSDVEKEIQNFNEK